MAPIISRPLYEKLTIRHPIQRTLDILILLLLSSLLVYRLLTLSSHGFAWFLALLCESWFTFMWVAIVSTKWNPIKYQTYPERLPLRVEGFLPAVDMLVTTADPVLEPPLITMNTVLSLLAVDYPANKLACYVSDDGCSPVTYYSLLQTSHFAKLWVPFCKKYNVKVRAPFRYFSDDDSISAAHCSPEFQRDWSLVKDEYEELSRKINEAAEKSIDVTLDADFAVFSDAQRTNHPSIIKVIWENKEGNPEEIPHLIYVSREKRPKHPHHYKAGAMNVLARVSGLITNAPFILNVDCDMFANNPNVVHEAMCFFLNSMSQIEFAFVQFPQVFHDELEDDPFGTTLKVVYEYLGRGVASLQGPFYGGTGCFHTRKVIYGLCPEEIATEANNVSPISGDFGDKELTNIFGNSTEFIKSASQALQGKTRSSTNICELIDSAYQVASCGYEHGTAWGTEVGWQYGSTTEDILTGLVIHSRGWRSAYCDPDPPGFLGSAPTFGPAFMTQQKRWATGLLEILVTKKSPIISAVTSKLEHRQCLAYLWILVWGLRSIPEICYMILPPYCIITNTNFLPKLCEPAMYVYVAVITLYCVYTTMEYLKVGLSIRAWWNKIRMTRITTTSAWFFGVISVVLKVLGISETVFEVTQKENSPDGASDLGKFIFTGSPVYVPGTTILLMQLSALASLFSCDNFYGFLELQFGEILCSLLVVIFLWPYVKGLFGKGKYGIPMATICKSAILTLCFVCLGKWPSGYL